MLHGSSLKLSTTNGACNSGGRFGVPSGTTHNAHHTTTTRLSSHAAAAAVNARVIDHGVPYTDSPSPSPLGKTDKMPFPLSLSSLDAVNRISTSSSSSLALSNHWSTTTFEEDREVESEPMEMSWGPAAMRESGSEWGGFARQRDDVGSRGRDSTEESAGVLRWKRSRAPTTTTRVQDQGRTAGPYPCPFRKRNPAKFNVREHETCARGVFGSVGELRHHILDHHQKRRRRHQCPRCGVGLDSQALLDEHLLMPRDKMCDIMTKSQEDPEDGISPEVERRLLSGGDIVTWEALWGVVFPLDDDVPNRDIHPIIELVEIEQAIDDSQDQLKASIYDKLRLLLPATIDDSYCTFLTGQLELVVETHRANVIRQCLAPSGKGDKTNDNKTTTPAAKRTSTIALAKRQTRRSRRSSIMQSVQGTKIATDDRSRQSWLNSRPGSSSRFSAQSNIPKPQPPTSRDSRDSGIGMSCEVCGGEDAGCFCEPSQVNTVQPAPPRPWDRQPEFDRYQHPNLSSSSVASSSGSSTAGDSARSLRHKPRLRLTLRTKDIGALLVPGQGGAGDGAAERGYSPQSFKQRVQGLGRGWSA